MQKRIKKIIGSEQGTVLVITMLILVVLTIIGIAANRTSILEVMISSAGKQKQGAFYAAEAGLEHAKAYLSEQMDIAKEGDPTIDDWTFMLNGTQNDPDDVGTLDPATGRNKETGVKIFESKALSGGNYVYDVIIWDNLDGNGVDEDSDRILIAHSIGRGTKSGGFAAVQSAIAIGTTGGVTLTRYIQEQTSQKYGGTGKASSNEDLNKVDLYDDDGNVNEQLKDGGAA